MEFVGIIIIFLIGIVTFTIRSGNGGKNVYDVIIVTLTASLIAMSLFSCRSKKVETIEKTATITQQDFNYSQLSTLVSQLSTLNSQLTSSSTTDINIIDSVVEKEYIDSTGVKVKEKATYHNEHHNNATKENKDDIAQSTNVTQSEQTNISASSSETKEKEYKKEKQSSGLSTQFYITIGCIIFVIILLVIFVCLYKLKKIPFM